MNHPAARERLIVALDVENETVLTALARQLAPQAGMLKIGLEAFTALGPRAIEIARQAGARVFLDLKLHDIPQTVARAAIAAARLEPALLNLHASGGEEMMRRAAAAVRDDCAAAGRAVPRLLAVTLLTSIGLEAMGALGLAGDPLDWVRRWSALAQRSGLDGVVVAASEAAAVKSECGAGFLVVTPGIRPAWAADPGDQQRVATPAAALAAGADYLVIGRPITATADPAAAARAVVAEIARHTS